jgi:hypothetical protein
MARYKGDGKDQDRRKGASGNRIGGVPRVEALEERRLLDGNASVTPLWTPTNTNVADTVNGPMANLGANLVKVYQEFKGANFQIQFKSSLADVIQIKGNQAGVDVKINGDMKAGLTALTALGFSVSALDTKTNIAEGFIPIANLPAMARLPQVLAAAPIQQVKPDFQGLSPNQAEGALNFTAVRTQFPLLTGAGVKIGVLSDSVNKLVNTNGTVGLAGSILTGDLPSNVTVLQDAPDGVGSSQTDEGRAMLEEIYDLAPGAQLFFATAVGGPVAFANNIRALAAAGCQVIVDDIPFTDQPFFQDGVIAQAVTDVRNQYNVIYLSAAGNNGDAGYESPFRGTSTTVADQGAGTYMDFDPGSGTTTRIPVTFSGTTNIQFQFDQPFYTTTGVTSNVDIFVINSAGVTVASGTSNNIATQLPEEFIAGIAAGSYTVAIKLVSGSPVGRVRFSTSSRSDSFVTQFSPDANTTYPTMVGQRNSADSLAVGAVPWFNLSPDYSNTKNESFSASGPSHILFDASGNRLPALQTRLKPDISATDGINTSFFGSKFPDGTIPGNKDPLSNFFGTSAAAPNAAAVAVLMKQLNPNITVDQARTAFGTTATPLLGQSQSVWTPEAGYGLINAAAALSAVNLFQVSSSTPANNASVASAPTSVTLTFSKAVNPTTLNASDLIATSLPAGVSVVIGTPFFPVAGDATRVSFPLTYVRTGATANGNYAFSVAAGTVQSADGTALAAAYSVRYTLADTIAPKVLSTQVVGRLVFIQFSEALDPATATPYNIGFAARGNGSYPNNLSLDPRTIFVVNAATGLVTINLTALPQTSLPTDSYVIVATGSVTDVVGNAIDGEFSGSFPSGNNVPGGAFVQNLGRIAVTAPVIVALTLATDTGIPGDNNTRSQQPTFVGKVATTFPGSVAGLRVLVQFNGLNGYQPITLGLGANGRGFIGSFDRETTTDAFGQFSVTAPSALADGFNQIRVVVIAGQDLPNEAGYSTYQDSSFRVDTVTPSFFGTTTDIPVLVNGVQAFGGDRISSLTSMSIAVGDPNVTSGNLLVPSQQAFPALDPSRVSNVSNYQFYLFDPATGAAVDYSSAITSAVFVPGADRTVATLPYIGRINLTFNAGSVPAGLYVFKIKQLDPTTGVGITDAAGNSFDGDPTKPGAQDFVLTLNINTEPVYLKDFFSFSSDGSVQGPRSYFEQTGTTPNGAPAPPTQFQLDFSSPLNVDSSRGPLINFDTVQVFASRNSDTAAPDGDFGNFGITTDANGVVNTGGQFTRINGVQIILDNSDVSSTAFGQAGVGTRLRVILPSGLKADNYRIYIPNAGNSALLDAFGNKFDGEFLGNPDTTGNSLRYETFLPNGLYRPGMTGDGRSGGSFVTGFTIVPHGNVIFVNPDAIDNPFIASDDPDGTAAHPYSALAPEAVANTANGNDANSSLNFGTGFNRGLDRNGNGQFDRSAFVAAQQKVAANGGPALILALPGLSGRSFVIQAPSGQSPTLNDGSASIPALTGLIMNQGTTTKLQNASMLVQQNGAWLQLKGGSQPSERVSFTSYANDAIGGDTNRDGASSAPRGGDWGGIVFRKYDNTGRGTSFTVDGVMPSTAGADDVMSSLNFANLSYGGGTVPQTTGTRYDTVTLFNSRPTLTNLNINFTGQTAGTQAPISGDLNSFREDDISRGPLIRRVSLQSNTINAILVRPEANGLISPSNAINYADDTRHREVRRSFAFNEPLPLAFLATVQLGNFYLEASGGQTSSLPVRLNVQPGSLLKFTRGAGIEVNSRFFFGAGSQLNVGDRNYIDQFDINANFASTDIGFRPAEVGSAKVVMTSFFDDLATTVYVDNNLIDPATGLPTVRTIVPAMDSDGGGTALQPSPGNVKYEARWGGVTVDTGSIFVTDEAQYYYGGGAFNTPDSTDILRPVIFLPSRGARVMVTNNDFYDNADAPIGVEPDALMAGDPLRPLVSAHPFFRGNVMQRNAYNGLRVYAIRAFVGSGAAATIVDLAPLTGSRNVFVNTVWDATDLTYILKGTLQLSSGVNLTMQSAVPGTRLANGEIIGRPGESVLVKLLNDYAPAGDGVAGSTSSVLGGAGFIAGVDNGIDPDADSLVDPGENSSIRILGVPANETSGQTRVPVYITSLKDSSIARSVRGVDQSVSSTIAGAAAPGDGGIIYLGGLSQTSTNLFDPSQGSSIDNADIRFMTRIEIQGGGILRNAIDVGPPVAGSGSQFGPADGTYTNLDDLRSQKNGLNPITHNFDPRLINNSSLAVRFAASNLSGFSQVGILSHPGFNLLAKNPALTPAPGDPFIVRTGVRGRPVDLFLVNNTLSNMPTGVRVISETTTGPFDQFGTAADSQQEPFNIVLLNNTFNNTDTGLNTISQPLQVGTAFNLYSSVRWLAMDNIFANNKTEGITSVGMIIDSDAQYNLYFGNGSNLSYTNRGVDGSFPTDAGATFGDPKFRNAAAGDFRLQPGSAAIDGSRSEVGPNFFGNVLQPIFTSGGVRTNGRQRSGLGFFSSSDLVSLPGLPLNDYSRVAIPRTPAYVIGSGTPNSNTYTYTTIQGERDQAGFLRQDDALTANTGFGSLPFFDIGAHEFRQLFPPHVVTFQTVTGSGQSVQATRPDGSTVDLYSVGALAGINATPTTIRFAFDRSLDPTTINNLTVLLQASGQDGIFGNGNSPADAFLDLSGKILLDPFDSRVLIINVGAAGLALASDEYRITLKGTGTSVIRDTSGNALDGENVDANGNQLPLPSGDGFPGGNFLLTFTVDTTSPSFIPGSVILDPASDTNIVGDKITSNNKPSFLGQITDTFPPVNPLQNQTIYLEYFNPTAGGYQLAGMTSTDISGNFAVPTSVISLPDTPFNVGNDGILGTADDSGTTTMRITAQDTSGNLSAPAIVGGIYIDTVGPIITGLTPTPNSQPPLVNGTVTFTLTFNENVDLSTFNTNTLVLVGAGGDGNFNSGNEQSIPVTPSSIVATYYNSTSALHTAQGQMSVSFSFGGFTRNDQYQLTVRGSGANKVTDIAGNAILGGTDLATGIVVYSPSLSKSFFVGGAGYVLSPTDAVGSRFNPYPSINAAIAAAGTGDVVGVLPGAYSEAVILKSLVTVMSVDPSSVAGNFIPGNAQETVIRAPLTTDLAVTSVTANNILSTSGLATTFQGFTVSSTLLGNPATGLQNPSSTGMSVTNSNILITKNYFINSGVGLAVNEGGAGAAAPLIQDNGLVGNGVGLSINDSGGTTLPRPIQVANNTVAFNSYGIVVNALSSSPGLAQTVNNIFWQNRDLGTTHQGAAIYASFTGKITSNNNLYSNNGPNLTSPADDTVNVTNGFNPSILTASPDSLGNFTGAPVFVAPRDPRPQADGPGVFFQDGNFDLQLTSAAIDSALGNQAPPTDFRSRGRVRIPGRGFPGTGPADVGAFEFNGSAGVAAGASFRVVSTSLAESGGPRANNRTVSGSGLNTVVVTFSGFPNAATIVPSDLVLSGDAVDNANPIRATSLTWLNAYTVQFNLNGNLRSTGTLVVSIGGNTVADSMNGRGNAAFLDSVQISTPFTPSAAAPVTPQPAAAPVASGPSRSPVKVSAAQARAAANTKAAAARAAKAAAARAAAANRVAHRNVAVPKGPARAFRA